MKFLITYVGLFSVLLFLTFPVLAQKQHPPFWKDIQQFKKQDQQNPPPKKATLFIGSSSFTKWTDVQDYFPKHKIVNRGFGGSTLPDVIRYADDIIFPYKPKQIVIYAGDNDAAASDTISGTEIFYRFKELYTLLRENLPNAEIAYISIKPSPSRKEFFPVMQKANWEIKRYLEEKEHSEFIDIWHPMLDNYGEPRGELFGSDMLHMNEEGYKIWKEVIEPYLVAQ